MACRNLTARFEELRSRSRQDSRKSFSLDGSSQLLPTADDKVAIAVGLGHSLPPQWVDIVESIQSSLANIKVKLGKLQNLHAVRLKVNFGDDESKTEREIEILTQDITHEFRLAENGLKSIATVGNARGTNLPTKERMVRLNVMRSLAADMQNLSQKFRHTQKDFVMRLRGQQEVGSEFFMGDDDSKEALSLTDAMEKGFTADHIAQLEQLENTASDREREIIKIAQSVNDLATVFRELNVLVIEQGTIVDRIDYNVEVVLTNVKEANVELKKADEYSKKSRSVICILVLFLICVILGVILAFKESRKKDDNSGKFYSPL